jgi:hypothetical protein
MKVKPLPIEGARGLIRQVACRTYKRASDGGRHKNDNSDESGNGSEKGRAQPMTDDPVELDGHRRKELIAHTLDDLSRLCDREKESS